MVRVSITPQIAKGKHTHIMPVYCFKWTICANNTANDSETESSNVEVRIAMAIIMYSIAYINYRDIKNESTTTFSLSDSGQH
jgi:hypothetical protein